MSHAEWPASLIPRAQELYDSGLSTKQVARLLGPSNCWMVRHLETRSPEEAKTSRAYYSRLTGIDYDAAERAALRLYVEGWTCQEIARRFGCSAQSVCAWVDKAEIKKRTLSEARRLAAKRRKEREVA